jgi:hypothetical protein
LDWSRAIPFLGIFVSNFGIVSLQCSLQSADNVTRVILNWRYVSSFSVLVGVFVSAICMQCVYSIHRLNMEVDFQSFIWASCHVMCTAGLIGWDSATPHRDSYTRALLVSKDRRHLLVTPWQYCTVVYTIRIQIFNICSCAECLASIYPAFSSWSSPLTGQFFSQMDIFLFLYYCTFFRRYSR